MTKQVTGRINRRGIFTATDGRAAPAAFGREWRDRWTGRARVRVKVDLDNKTYAGIVYAKADTITLPRQYAGAGK